MSELDYELASIPSPDIIELFETEENEINALNTCETSFSKATKIAGPEIIDLCQTDESDIEKLETNDRLEVKVSHKSNETYSDLEEGEIKESADECNNNDYPICKYFRKGICYLGENCRFLHAGVGSCKTFESNITNHLSSIVNPLPVYNPVELGYFPQVPPDSWDKGLEEAKKLVLRAKLMKETDLDFEEKQLYQGLDDYKIFESAHERKICLSDKHKKRKGTPLQKNSGLRGKSQAILWTPTPKETKSRTRNRTKVWLSHHDRSLSSNSSTCSECVASYCSDKPANPYLKTKSKLERAFSKALDTPETSRSRRKQSYRHTFRSYLRKRSLSKNTFIKRFIYQSYSKSPSPSKTVNFEKHLKRGIAHKSLHKQRISLSDTRRKRTSLYSDKEPDSSPFTKLLSENDWLESYSSDMTVSSLKCTSVSCASSEENESSAIGSRRVSSDQGINVDCKKERESSHDINTWLNNVTKSAKETEESRSEIVKKTGDKIMKNLKPSQNDTTRPKYHRKKLSWSTSEDELSADEQEILKYIPSKNQKLEQMKNELSENTETKLTLKPSLQNIPQKVVCDFGSDAENITKKIVHDCGSKEESFKSIKTCNGQNMDDHDTNGDNSKKELVKPQQTNTTLLQKSKSTTLENFPLIEILDDVQQSGQEILKQNDISCLDSSKRKLSSSESSSFERQYSADELELLKYVGMGNPTTSKVIKKQRLKNPPPMATKKIQQTKESNSVDSKLSCQKSAGQVKSRTTKMSRRERLMKQLEAVELAIAKKKQVLKLESVNGRKSCS